MVIGGWALCSLELCCYLCAMQAPLFLVGKPAQPDKSMIVAHPGMVMLAEKRGAVQTSVQANNPSVCCGSLAGLYLAGLHLLEPML